MNTAEYINIIHDAGWVLTNGCSKDSQTLLTFAEAGSEPMRIHGYLTVETESWFIGPGEKGHPLDIGGSRHRKL